MAFTLTPVGNYEAPFSFEGLHLLAKLTDSIITTQCLVNSDLVWTCLQRIHDGKELLGQRNNNSTYRKYEVHCDTSPRKTYNMYKANNTALAANKALTHSLQRLTSLKIEIATSGSKVGNGVWKGV